MSRPEALAAALLAGSETTCDAVMTLATALEAPEFAECPVQRRIRAALVALVAELDSAEQATL